MRYWQKLFFYILLLFLLVSNGSIFVVTKAMLDGGRQREEAYFLRQARQMEQKIQEDLTALEKRDALDTEALASLADGYAAQMGDGWMQLSGHGAIYGSNLPFAQAGDIWQAENGQRQSWWRKKDGVWYYNTQSVPVKGIKAYFLFEAKQLEEQERKMLLTGLLFSAVSALLLMIPLYVILQLSNRPLSCLSEAARQIAGGAYEKRVTFTVGVRPGKKSGRSGQPAGGDEMIRLARDFNKMADAVEEKIAALSEESRRRQEFIDNFTHEMRMPLTMITGYGQMLRLAALDETERFEAVEHILMGAVRLETLQGRLMALCMLGQEETEKKEVSVLEVLNLAMDGQSAYAQKNAVCVHLEGRDCPVMGDGALLLSLFDNLLHNAIRAAAVKEKTDDETKEREVFQEEGADSGRVVIRCEPTDGETRVTVSDNGPGMTEDQLARIGEPFYRVDKARSRSDGGAGLGVTLCRKIMEAHGGSLSYRSQPGKGTLATVVFPETTEKK